MQVDLRLEHEVFQHRGFVVGRYLRRWAFIFGHADRAQTVGDGRITILLDLAFHQGQSLLITVLVGIDFADAIESVCRAQEVTGGVVQLEERDQRVTVIVAHDWQS